MDINKINIKELFLKYLPFLIFFIIVFIWNSTLPRGGDDLDYAKIFYKYNYNVFSFLSWHYEVWSSRWLIESFLVLFATLPKIIWNFFDSIIFLLMTVLIPKIVLNTEKIGTKKLFAYNSLSCIFVLIFIFTTYYAIYSAGYIATPLNYTWPLCFGLLHFYLVKKYIFTENHSSTGYKLAIYLIMIFALVFTINQEIMLVIVSGVYFFIFIYCLYYKIKIPNSLFLMLFIIFLGYLNIYLCPGNHVRYYIELSRYFPDYYTLSLVNKIDLGISVLLNRILFSYSLISPLFFGILTVYVYSITKKKASIVINLMPIIILITLGLMIFVGYTPIGGFINDGVTKYGLLHSSLNHILVNSVLYAIILFSIIYSLIQIYIYRGKKFSLIIFCLLALGFVSQIMRGFSPTVWASAQRWEIYYYFFVILSSYILTVDLLESKYDNCKNWLINHKIWKIILNSISYVKIKYLND